MEEILQYLIDNYSSIQSDGGLIINIPSMEELQKEFDIDKMDYKEIRGLVDRIGISDIKIYHNLLLLPTNASEIEEENPELFREVLDKMEDMFYIETGRKLQAEDKEHICVLFNAENIMDYDNLVASYQNLHQWVVDRLNGKVEEDFNPMVKIEEVLNDLDKRELDEAYKFYDLKNLYEAMEDRLTPQEKTEIANLARTTDDPDVIASYLNAKVYNDQNNLNEEYEEYKGYGIEYDGYGEGEYTVQYKGDDVWFASMEDAKAFIDEVTSEEEPLDEDFIFITVDGKDYPVRDREYLNGKLATAEDEMGLQHICDVTLRKDRYSIYDCGFENVDDDSCCAIKYDPLELKELKQQEKLEQLEESLSEDDIKECAYGIEEYVYKSGFDNYDLIDYEEYPMDTIVVTFRIDGDWKHEHLRFNWLVREWAEKNNKTIYKIDEIPVEEDGSDYYVSDHQIFITSPESAEQLNSMSALFNSDEEDMDESLCEGRGTRASHQSKLERQKMEKAIGGALFFMHDYCGVTNESIANMALEAGLHPDEDYIWQDEDTDQALNNFYNIIAEYIKNHQRGDEDDAPESITKDLGLNESAGTDKAAENADSLTRFLDDNDFYSYELRDYEGSEGASRVIIRVEGDWKHEHGLFDNLLNRWASKNNKEIVNVSQRTVKEDGTDYFTADYGILINNNVNESLNESKTSELNKALSKAKAKVEEEVADITDVSVLKDYDDICDMEFETDPEWDEDFWYKFRDYLREHPLHLDFYVEQYDPAGTPIGESGHNTETNYYYGVLKSMYNDFDENGAEWGYQYESLNEGHAFGPSEYADTLYNSAARAPEGYWDRVEKEERNHPLVGKKARIHDEDTLLNNKILPISRANNDYVWFDLDDGFGGYATYKREDVDILEDLNDEEQYSVYQDYEGYTTEQFTGTYEECEQWIEQASAEQEELYGNEYPEFYIDVAGLEESLKEAISSGDGRPYEPDHYYAIYMADGENGPQENDNEAVEVVNLYPTEIDSYIKDLNNHYRGKLFSYEEVTDKEYGDWMDNFTRTDDNIYESIEDGSYLVNSIYEGMQYKDTNLIVHDDGVDVRDSKGNFKGRYATEDEAQEAIDDEDMEESLQEALVEPSEEIRKQFEEILTSNGFTIDSVDREQWSDNYPATYHYQVRKPGSKVSTREEVIAEVDAMCDKLIDLDDSTNTPITWSFGPDRNGELTGGLDIRETYVKDGEE